MPSSFPSTANVSGPPTISLDENSPSCAPSGIPTSPPTRGSQTDCPSTLFLSTPAPTSTKITNFPTLPTSSLQVTVITWTTTVEVLGVSANCFDNGAQAAFVAVTLNALSDSYDDIIILSIVDMVYSKSVNLKTVLYLRRDSVSETEIGSVVSFSTRYVSQHGESEVDVEGITSTFENRIKNYYSDPSTVQLWISESIARGSITINETTAASFGEPVLNHSTTVMMVSDTAAPSAVSAHHANGSGHQTNEMLAISIPIIFCVLSLTCFIAYWYSKRKHSASSNTSVELTTTNKHPVETCHASGQ